MRSIGVAQLVKRDGRLNLGHAARLNQRPHVVILPPGLSFGSNEESLFAGLARGALSEQRDSFVVHRDVTRAPGLRLSHIDLRGPPIHVMRALFDKFTEPGTGEE